MLIIYLSVCMLRRANKANRENWTRDNHPGTVSQFNATHIVCASLNVEYLKVNELLMTVDICIEVKKKKGGENPCWTRRRRRIQCTHTHTKEELVANCLKRIKEERDRCASKQEENSPSRRRIEWLWLMSAVVQRFPTLRSRYATRQRAYSSTQYPKQHRNALSNCFIIVYLILKMF